MKIMLENRDMLELRSKRKIVGGSLVEMISVTHISFVGLSDDPFESNADVTKYKPSYR